MVHSVFFGGGTPSLFHRRRLIVFCSKPARGACGLPPTRKSRSETNPGTVEHGPFAGYRAAGVNRLSFGVQSFDDGCLQRLGRIHSSRDAERAIQSAQDAASTMSTLT